MSVILRSGAALAAAAMLTAATGAQAGQPAAAAPAAGPQPAASEWRIADPENLLVIMTTKGRVIVEMRPDVNPAAVERIKTLTRRNFFDGLAFFRVIDDFMAQTGDPVNDGTGQSDLPNLTDYFTFRRGLDMPFSAVATQAGQETGFVGPLPATSQSEGLMLMTADGKVNAYPHFCPGVAAMARASVADSANSQFFLMRQNNPNLERRYSAWGRVVIGLDVVRAIAVGEPPPAPDRMNTVRIAADMPAAERPSVRVLDTAGPTFRAMAAATRAARGPSFNICELDVPAQGG